MARKKKEVEVEIEVKNEGAFSLGESDGFYDTFEDAESASADGANDNDYEFSKNIRTFNLPAQDAGFSYLLSREKDGEIMITNRELFPMKEGYILACVEYEVL